MERALLVCRSEWPPLLWMMGLSFVLNLGATLGFCSSNAIFMSAIFQQNYGLHVFPLAFIICGAVMIPCFILYNHMERIIHRHGLLIFSFFTWGLFSSVSAYLLEQYPGSYYLIMAVFILSASILLLVNLQLWSFANLIFHPRQGKRLFPLLGMGGVAGSAVMGFMVKHLVEAMGGVSRTFYLWSGIFLVAALLVHLIYQNLEVPLEIKPRKVRFWRNIELDFKIMDRLPLLRVMASIIFILSAVSFILYFRFNYQLGQIFPLGEDFAAFVGDFSGVLNLTILAYQVFLTGRLVSGMGIINSLFLYPGMLAIPVLGMMLFPGLYIPVISAHFVDELTRETIFQTVSESIYGSIPNVNRERAMSLMKMVVTPLSIGASGMILLIVYRVFPDTAHFVSGLFLPILLGLWGFFIWHLKDLYIDTLFGNFVSGSDTHRLESFRALTQLKGVRTRELLQRTLQKGSRRMKMFALELAGEMKITPLKKEIFDFLQSQDVSLKTQAITALGKIGGKDLYPKLMKVYKSQDGPIRLLLLDSLQKIDPWNFGINAPLLIREEDDPMAQAYLLEYIWSRKELLTEQKEIFRNLLISSNPQVRRTAAHCLSFDKDRLFELSLLELLEDPDSQVLKEAIHSAGVVRSRAAVPRLLDLLESPEATVAEDALRALVNIRYDVVGELLQRTSMDDPAEILSRKLRIVARIGDAQEQFTLLDAVNRVMPEAAAPALEEMARNLKDYRTFNRRESGIIREFIEAKTMQIRDEFKAAYALRKKFEDQDQPTQILLMLLQERIDTLRRIILLGLHLLRPHEKFLTVMENIFSGDLRKKNIAVEALENLLTVDYRRMIIPLFEKDNLVEEMEYVVDLYNLESDDYDQMLDILSRYGDSWMKAWAFYTAGVLHLESWRTLMEEAVNSDDKLLSEHAGIGLRLLNVRPLPTPGIKESPDTSEASVQEADQESFSPTPEESEDFQK